MRQHKLFKMTHDHFIFDLDSFYIVIVQKCYLQMNMD